MKTEDARMTEFMDIYNAPIQALIPELQTALDDWGDAGGMRFIKLAPFVNSLYCGERENGRLNEMLIAKRHAYDTAVANCKWGQALCIVERPWRPEMLLELESKLTPEEFAQCLCDVWTGAEALYQSETVFSELWDIYHANAQPEHLMSASERCIYRDLPDTVTVWRGCDGEEGWEYSYGQSWTLDKKKACWFSTRLNAGALYPKVMQAEVPREHVLAYFDERGEREVVVSRDFLRDYSDA